MVVSTSTRNRVRDQRYDKTLPLEKAMNNKEQKRFATQKQAKLTAWEDACSRQGGRRWH